MVVRAFGLIEALEDECLEGLIQIVDLYGCQNAVQADPFIAEESSGAVMSNV